jgi:hypothetical protein
VLLHIATFITQVDLFNVSLTSKALRSATEPELYREYRSRDSGFKLLLLRHLIQSPKLALFLQHLDLDPWTALMDLSVGNHLPVGFLFEGSGLENFRSLTGECRLRRSLS